MKQRTTCFRSPLGEDREEDGFQVEKGLQGMINRDFEECDQKERKLQRTEMKNLYNHFKSTRTIILKIINLPFLSFVIVFAKTYARKIFFLIFLRNQIKSFLQDSLPYKYFDRILNKSLESILLGRLMIICELFTLKLFWFIKILFKIFL